MTEMCFRAGRNLLCDFSSQEAKVAEELYGRLISPGGIRRESSGVLGALQLWWKLHGYCSRWLRKHERGDGPEVTLTDKEADAVRHEREWHEARWGLSPGQR